MSQVQGGWAQVLAGVPQPTGEAQACNPTPTHREGGPGRLWAVCPSAERGEAEEGQELPVSIWEKARPHQAEAPSSVAFTRDPASGQ